LMKLSSGSGIRAGGRIGAPLHVTINMVASHSQLQTTPNRYGRKWLIPLDGAATGPG
jgi:hypothetical protein